MTASRSVYQYPLGNTDAEHERLIRQAVRLAPVTERLFREAGIGTGQRVLDLGSGVGDVAMLAAGLVGSSGEVVGLERDKRSIARARARVAEAGQRNVTFIQFDAGLLENQLAVNERFDAAVGRFVLQFIPAPADVLRSLFRLVRPGGVLAFQEVCYAPFLALSAHLPLWFAVACLIRDTFQRSGANTEIGLALYKYFQEAWLPAPAMHLEVPLGSDSDFTRLIYDLLASLRPQIPQRDLKALGDFDTLQERLHAEVATSTTVVPYMAIVAAWCRKPRCPEEKA